MSLIYVICQDEEEARNIGIKLLKKRLCACVNIIDGISSLSFWPPKSDTIHEAQETILLIKTIKENFAEINKEILELHSYEVPCVFSVDAVDVDGKYFNWLCKQIG
ncbi:MAG: CutA1 divalent ion tolerance protein [uncultured bacterium]|nr:MAG: CutA1 divalent ion tolerance protein [uncultured bacterium]